jgi:hypothetical protein
MLFEYLVLWECLAIAGVRTLLWFYRYGHLAFNLLCGVNCVA